MTDTLYKTRSSAKKIKTSAPSYDFQGLANTANNDEDGVAGAGTGNENDALLNPNPNSSRSPEEMVFSIDHILESILGKCDRQTLLNSRLVSRRWAVYGSKELQKIVSIAFFKGSSTVVGSEAFRFTSDETRSLKDLITVMTNSTEFPCTAFDLRSMGPEPRGKTTKKHSATPFFNAHGASIKKIIFHGEVYIEALKQLLLKQAPNLEQLYLGRMINVKYTNSIKRPRNSETEEQQSERETLQASLFIQETTSKPKPKPILKNLKVFKCPLASDLPEIFMEQILECSPNLVEVLLPRDYPHLLVQPQNRLHLLKKLKVDMNSFNIESYELFGKHLQDAENFAVSELYFRTGVNYEEDGDAEFYERVSQVMRKILRASAATCQKLSWSDEVDNLQFPQMPRVKHLTIQYFLEDDEEAGYVVNSLRPCRGGVNLGDTFPNLTSLDLGTRAEMVNDPMPNIFNDVDPSAAAKVKTVTLRLRHPGPKVVQSFKDMFPNASFRRKVDAESDHDLNSDKGSDSDESEDGSRKWW